jgi:hypothetical protein
MLSFPAALPAQTTDITEENYLRLDSLMLMQYERDVASIFSEREEHPDRSDYLNALYARTSRDDFEIVMYCLYSDPESFPNERAAYPCEYVLVSDFLLDSSPVKIIYGAQATPTCFFIDREGVVRMKSLGLDTGRVDELSAKGSSKGAE